MMLWEIPAKNQECKTKSEPWKSKDYFLNGFSVETIVLVGIYNQQFKGTILFMVFDFQGESKNFQTGTFQWTPIPKSGFSSYLNIGGIQWIFRD